MLAILLKKVYISIKLAFPFPPTLKYSSMAFPNTNSETFIINYIVSCLISSFFLHAVI